MALIWSSCWSRSCCGGRLWASRWWCSCQPSRTQPPAPAPPSDPTATFRSSSESSQQWGGPRRSSLSDDLEVSHGEPVWSPPAVLGFHSPLRGGWSCQCGGGSLQEMMTESMQNSDTLMRQYWKAERWRSGNPGCCSLHPCMRQWTCGKHHPCI